MMITDAKKLLVAIATDNIHSSAFTRTITNFNPDIIADLRFAPHFYFTAGDYGSIKNLINQSVYIRYPIPFHDFRQNYLKADLHNVAKGLISVFKNHIKQPSDMQTVMFLVTEEDSAKKFSPFLAAALTYCLGGIWPLALVSNNE